MQELDSETKQRMEKLRKMQQASNKPPKTNQELFSRLKQAGKAKRKEKETVIQSGIHKGEIKRPRLTFREITNIVEQYAIFRVIGDDEEEQSKAPLYWYNLNKGVYVKDDTEIKQLINYVDNQATDKAISEVYNKLFLESKRVPRTHNSNLVIVNNGIFDKSQNKLLPFSSDYVFTTKIATNYNPDASSEPVFNGWSVSKWFDEIADGQEDKLKLLWQIITASIDANISHESAIFLIDDGQGRTGKSTFENLIMNLVGKNNCGQLKLIEFEDDFKLALVDSKAVIIGDDNDPNSFNEDSSKFKSLTTGETILINPKGMKPYYNRFNSLIIQSMNGVPRFKDSTDAHLRRFRIVKFNHQYEATSENRKIKDDYINRKELLEWLLYKALHSKTVTTFIQSNESINATQEIKEDNDPVYYFINKYFADLESTRIPSTFLFNYFMACMDAENNHSRIKQRTFTLRAQKILKAKGWEYTPTPKLKPLKYWNGKDQQKLDELRNGQLYLCNVDPEKYQRVFYSE